MYFHYSCGGIIMLVNNTNNHGQVPLTRCSPIKSIIDCTFRPLVLFCYFKCQTLKFPLHN